MVVVRSGGHFHLDEPQPDEPVQADWMLGGFLLLRRAMLDELGGFDEGFRLYGEDIDLAYRAMRAGWERWYVPEAGSSGTSTRRRPTSKLADAPHALALGGHRSASCASIRSP